MARSKLLPNPITFSATATLPPPQFVRDERLLPLGALLLAGSLNATAQNPPTDATRELKPLEVHTKTQTLPGKDTLRADTTTIGKGNQELRNIPQSITVVTEKLIDDRHLDTIKEVLRNTAGVTFQAAEGGEEDIRLRGFSLATTGDLFIDGMRDPAFYDRDTFNNDRVELLRGSASMLFGRGSTGGAVNQVSKLPRLITEHEVTATVGSHNYRRLTGDFNLKTGENAALRLNAMVNTADNNGSGSSINKRGVAAAYSFGIGEKDEFTASLYSLDNQNGINYGLPWIRPNAAASTQQNTILGGLDPSAYYGLASDRNDGSAQWLALKHIHRFDHDNELQMQVRHGRFTRDLRASTIRFAGTGPASAIEPLLNAQTPTLANLGDNTVLNRGTALKIQQVDTTHLQSDYSNKFALLGLQHELQGGLDFVIEKKAVSLARTAAQGGVDLIKPQASYGNANTGTAVDEDSRVLRPGNDYQTTGYGIYAQDLVQVAKDWKVLLGLRFDNLRGSYSTYTIPASAAGPLTTTSYNQDISAISKRMGVLYQPDPLHSYHFSYGTSFNTSGDVYSYNALSANTPPEASENIEFGARIDSANKLFTTRMAVFQSTKSNERNTDPDTAATRLLLTGKRHATGFEVDVTGRITREWEIYASYMWLPDAVVDVAASTATTAGNRAGDRPGLSPLHSGTVWSTYQLNPKLRVGGGLNFRSAQSPADTTAPSWEAPPFATLDLMAEYAINDRWTMKANVNNAGNVLYADSLYRGHYVPGAGRVWLLSLNTRF